MKATGEILTYGEILNNFKQSSMELDSYRASLEKLAFEMIELDQKAWYEVFPSGLKYLKTDYVIIQDDGSIQCWVYGKFGGEDLNIVNLQFPMTLLHGEVESYYAAKVAQLTKLRDAVDAIDRAKKIKEQQRATIKEQINKLQATLEQLV